MVINSFLKGIDMNKKLLISLVCVAFFTLQADEQNSSDVQISVTINKDVLARIVKKNPSSSFIEKFFMLVEIFFVELVRELFLGQQFCSIIKRL